MREYMEANNIPGSYHDPNVTALLREHFKKMGLVQVRRGNGTAWVPAEQAAQRRKVFNSVHKRLKEIENGTT